MKYIRLQCDHICLFFLDFFIRNLSALKLFVTLPELKRRNFGAKHKLVRIATANMVMDFRRRLTRMIMNKMFAVFQVRKQSLLWLLIFDL